MDSLGNGHWGRLGLLRPCLCIEIPTHDGGTGPHDLPHFLNSCSGLQLLGRQLEIIEELNLVEKLMSQSKRRSSVQSRAVFSHLQHLWMLVVANLW
eukprot:6308533-Amphidinium_carterae.1